MFSHVSVGWFDSRLDKTMDVYRTWMDGEGQHLNTLSYFLPLLHFLCALHDGSIVTLKSVFKTHINVL